MCDASILSSSVCADGNIRLLEGSMQSVSSGRVEVCYSNSYGSVCNSRWDQRDATVVCRRLGLGTTGESRQVRVKIISRDQPLTEAVAVRNGTYFGESDSTILLDDVVCQGNENNLLECAHNGIGQHDCTSQETAGVICGGKHVPSATDSALHSTH